ncbi:potassium transporter [Roseibium aquae]|uniref:Potassium transporter n=1 Tax=Roseibium aquae TaxID=1323746 RepID=A0A916TC54_9HYPH|nr:cation:proton antiporter [Roseibium aquae]GGB38370.1 potassium transporter [Roseibium aquae]
MDHAITLISLGLLLLVGMLADEIGHRTRLPRVTLLILCGLVAGPAGFDALPGNLTDLYDLLAVIALSMVAFLLGGKLSRINLRNSGRSIVIVSLTAVLITAVVVAGGLALAGMPLEIALVLGAMATATAPAATQDVIRQANARGHFTDVLFGVVALDDAWGLVVFALCLVWAQLTASMADTGVWFHAAWEIFGAIGLGCAIGVPAAYLTGRIRSGDPTLAEALGVVFLIAGLAIWLNVSFLLAGIVCGGVVVNFARHHHRPFHEIEHIEWPFMILFFFLAGALLEVDALLDLGLIGAVYVALRLAARVLGGLAGGRLAGLPPKERFWMGFTLVPQAGVALGMALVGSEVLPQYRNEILTIAIGSTVIFELLGPPLTQLALRRVGDARS